MPYRPGQSGNPSGRPRGAKGLARYIASQTEDGRELVDRLLEMSRDPNTPVRERVLCTMHLLDRGVGKPMTTAEIAVTIDAPLLQYPSNWASLTFDERSLWLTNWRLRQLTPGNVIDVDTDEIEDT